MSSSSSRSIAEQQSLSPYSGGNAEWIEALYEQYLVDPTQVSEQWQSIFKELADGSAVSHEAIRAEFKAAALQPRLRQATSTKTTVSAPINVQAWIQSYRDRGHRVAKLDPLGLTGTSSMPQLDPAFHGLSSNATEQYDVDGFSGQQNMTQSELQATLQKTYTGSIGVEFAHVTDRTEREWLYEHFEQGWSAFSLGADEQKMVLTDLVQAEGLERYLHTRFVGQKRFSLEGGESLIPLMQEVIRFGSQQGLEELVMGMAHRGRLSTLINIMGKPSGELFAGFESDYLPESNASGDVKYHLGYSSDVKGVGGNVHAVLMFNPSHLEIVNPVVMGSVRARQTKRRVSHSDNNRLAIMPLLVHGDAAFSGQGVTQEILQMSNTRGYGVGGTLHVLCNNQIGFTTAKPEDARSTRYASDVAKFVGAPILHVNGDDPEAVIFCARFATLYRQTFQRDVVIDLVCYRRNGHNEADEPAATQPAMYQVIRKHPSTLKQYASRLVEENVLAATEVEQYKDQYRDQLDAGGVVNNQVLGMIGNEFTADWSTYLEATPSSKVDTAIDQDTLNALTPIITHVPDTTRLHARVERLMQARAMMARGEQPCDWGFAETLAYASLLKTGLGVRISGQDSGRGTFFHRHAVLHDQDSELHGTENDHIPLAEVNENAHFEVIDSLLSEEAVLGFEYGFACTDPETLTIWEAQFGDFANGAQVVIDQFISSGEAKWGRMCGLTMLLPHGQEGQGPEHSSARLERYLQLCAERNMIVCMPTTPAQIFHLLRRQMLWTQRRPLIVMTPKSLLRHPEAVSELSAFTSGQFETVMGDDEVQSDQIERVVLCSGKVYYELNQQRQKDQNKTVALIRVEQLYPFPRARLKALLAPYTKATDVVWCQEEPENQGAWYEVRSHIEDLLTPAQTLRYAGRARAAAPAPGYPALHAKQQAQLINEALNTNEST